MVSPDFVRQSEFEVHDVGLQIPGGIRQLSSAGQLASEVHAFAVSIGTAKPATA